MNKHNLFFVVSCYLIVISTGVWAFFDYNDVEMAGKGLIGFAVLFLFQLVWKILFEKKENEKE